MNKFITLLALGLAMLGGAIPAQATQPIPQNSGFSGFINVGAGVLQSQNNMIAGSDLGQLSPKRIDSPTKRPDSKTNAIPVVDLELTYTFADTRTQIIAGSQLEDVLRFDSSNVLGIRQELPDQSCIGLFYAFTPMATSVWADPYVVGTDRKKTDRTAEGLRVGYDGILGTRLETELTWRKVTIDSERSGEAMALPASDAALLDRNGTIYSGKLSYPLIFQQMRHIVVPTLEITRHDLDGEAMAFDRFGVMISHAFNTQDYSLATNLYHARAGFDGGNPLYGVTQKDDIYGASFTAIRKAFLGAPRMNLVGTIAHFDNDSNIDFYDSRITMASLSVIYRFGAL